MSQNWNPLQDLLVLQDRMNRLFEDATQRRTRDDSESAEFERSDWTPAADIYEAEGSFLIAMDLPGISREALEIEVDENRLVLKGMRDIQELKQHRSERPHGRFVRTFTVPGSVDQTKIAAEYKDGVLQVTLPKRKDPKAQRVEIKVG
ncbi:MAG TPA: Hsp20/alpha crystallin family protein [Pyrinomonadaceae bacterium]|nr:Hsp20/alpha crystallin family protein [Pyrinomonadaceae bacterium]